MTLVERLHELVTAHSRNTPPKYLSLTILEAIRYIEQFEKEALEQSKLVKLVEPQIIDIKAEVVEISKKIGEF